MHQLRLLDSERAIWIDVISINQEDIEERGHQVGMMREIYSYAKTVHVWLGPELYWSEEVFRLLNGLKDRGIKAQNMDVVWNLATKRKMLELYTQMCNLEYWTRVWIVQEIIVAKDVNIHCGKGSIDWDTFSDILQEFLPATGDIGLGWASRNDFRKLSSSHAYNIHHQRRIRNLKSQDCRFIPLLEACENSVSHDPRDRIYGLLGLACDVYKDDFGINYDISLSELHRKVVQFYLKHTSPGNTKLVRFSQFVQRLFGGYVDSRKFGQLNPPIKENENKLPPMAEQLVNYSLDVEIPAFYRGSISTVCRLGCDRTRNQKGEIFLFLNFEPSNQWKFNKARDDGTYPAQEDREILGQMLSQSRRLAMDPLKDPWERLLRRTVPVQEIEEVHATKRIAFQMLNEHGELMSGLGIAAENVREGDLIYQFSRCDVAVIFRNGIWPGTTGGSRPLPISTAVISAPFVKRASNPLTITFGHDMPRPTGRRPWEPPPPLTAPQLEAMARSIPPPGNISEETLPPVASSWSNSFSYDALARSVFEGMHPGQPYLNRPISSSQRVPPGWIPPRDDPLPMSVRPDAIITAEPIQSKKFDHNTFDGERFSENSSVVFMYKTGSDLAKAKREEVDPDLLTGKFERLLPAPPTDSFVFNFATLQLISRW